MYCDNVYNLVNVYKVFYLVVIENKFYLKKTFCFMYIKNSQYVNNNYSVIIILKEVLM